MKHRSTFLSSLSTAVCGGTLILLSGCGDHGDHAHDHSSQGPAIAVASTDEVNVLKQYVQHLPAVPDDAIHLNQLPDQIGAKVTVQARVGGRLNPFITDMAAMIVADTTQITACDAMADDHCATPWDFCCEPDELVAQNTALVQVVGDNGAPVSEMLSGLYDIRPGSFVTIQGTLQQSEPSTIITAHAIHVVNK